MLRKLRAATTGRSALGATAPLSSPQRSHGVSDSPASRCRPSRFLSHRDSSLQGGWSCSSLQFHLRAFKGSDAYAQASGIASCMIGMTVGTVGWERGDSIAICLCAPRQTPAGAVRACLGGPSSTTQTVRPWALRISASPTWDVRSENSASQIKPPNHRLGHRPLGAYRPRRKPSDTLCIGYRRIYVKRALFEPLCSGVAHDAQPCPSLKPARLCGSSERHRASLSSRFPAPLPSNTRGARLALSLR